MCLLFKTGRSADDSEPTVVLQPLGLDSAPQVFQPVDQGQDATPQVGQDAANKTPSGKGRGICMATTTLLYIAQDIMDEWEIEINWAFVWSPLDHRISIGCKR